MRAQAAVAHDDPRLEDERLAPNRWVRYSVDVDSRVRYVGVDGENGPLRVNDEGTILLFELDPVKPYVQVEWDRPWHWDRPAVRHPERDDGPE